MSRLDRVFVAARLARVDLGVNGVRLATVLAACIGALTVLGSMHAFVIELLPFDLDDEQHLDRLDEGPWVSLVLPALFSAAVLFAAAALAFFVSARMEVMPWVVLGLFFMFMGADELLEFHEDLEVKTGVEWERLYLPLMLVGAAVWLAALNRMSRRGTERLLWLGGAAAWIAAVLLEVGTQVESESGGKPLPDETTVLEEVFEMVGSSMFLLALFAVCRRIVARRVA